MLRYFFFNKGIILTIRFMIFTNLTWGIEEFGNLKIVQESVCHIQSHYREVPRWEIFMEQELRFGLDLGRFGNFGGRFFHFFMGKKKFLKTL